MSSDIKFAHSPSKEIIIGEFSNAEEVLSFSWNIVYVFMAIAIAFGLGWAKLVYNNFLYSLTDTDFRKESGVIYKKYVSIPYEKIQNVNMTRNILERLFGLSAIQVETAGSSAVTAKSGRSAEGHLPGLSVQEAENLRNELLRRNATNKG